MRVYAVIGLVLFVAAAGVATHLAAGGKFDLSMLPGTEDLAIEFGWIEERGPEAYERADGSAPGAPAQTAARSDAAASRTSDPDDASADGMDGQANAVAPAAGPAPQVAAANAILNVPGRQAAQAPGDGGTAPVFAMPVACRPGIDCLVSSFVDMAAGEGYRDFECGALSYDEHKGTDIRLPSYVEMQRGYPVVAAAPGTVVAVRDGMPDANFNLFKREAVNDRGLGNVVAIDHGNGWRTFYGHMRRGSLTVSEGEAVEAGQKIGLIGLSGLTEFPHLHFQVQRNGDPIDPFTGLGLEGGCGIEGSSLWASEARAALKYPRTLLLRLGFSDTVLNKAAVEYMLFKEDGIPAANRSIILHAHFSGLLEGDRIEVRIFGPDGNVFAQAGVDIDEAAQSRILRVGKKDLDEPPDTGVYRGQVRYFRQTPDGPERLFETSESVEVR